MPSPLPSITDPLPCARVLVPRVSVPEKPIAMLPDVLVTFST
jgi:hypothetical protein